MYDELRRRKFSLRSVEPEADRGVHSAGDASAPGLLTGHTVRRTSPNVMFTIQSESPNLRSALLTHHTNMDTYERVVPEDVRKNAVIVASFVMLTANQDELFPRMNPIR